MSETYEVTILKNRITEMQAEIDGLRARLDAIYEKIHIGRTGNYAWRIEPPPEK